MNLVMENGGTCIKARAMRRLSKHEKNGKTYTLKSRLETQVWNKFPELEYESKSFPYVMTRKYTPDWKVNDHLYLESKGLFTAEDRQKHLLMKEQHPDVEVIMVFENANKRIHPRSTTTYAEWCNKHDIRWCDWREIKDKDVTIEELTQTNAD